MLKHAILNYFNPLQPLLLYCITVHFGVTKKHHGGGGGVGVGAWCKASMILSYLVYLCMVQVLGVDKRSRLIAANKVVATLVAALKGRVMSRGYSDVLATDVKAVF